MPNLAGIKETYLVVKGVAAGQDGSAVLLATGIDCQSKHRVLFEMITGTNTATGVIDMEVLEADTTDGVYTVIHKETFATGGDNDKIFQLDVPIRKRFVKTRYQRKTANSQILAATASVFDAKRVPTALADVKARVIK